MRTATETVSMVTPKLSWWAFTGDSNVGSDR